MYTCLVTESTLQLCQNEKLKYQIDQILRIEKELLPKYHTTVDE